MSFDKTSILGSVRLCILDFVGLARFNEHEFTDSVTVLETVMGTLSYMPPEQLCGDKIDERSDLFACTELLNYYVSPLRKS